MARDTIVALSTPPGEGALGVIRCTGPRAVEVLSCLASFPQPPEDRRAYLRQLRDGDDILDEVVVVVFYGPRSFTGEDTVEISCHGGRITLQRVLDAMMARGARPAEPGEFSRRALENGRLDLVQVEAIADIIHAESVEAQKLAQSHLAGRLSAALDAIRAPLFELVVLVEAAIDFSLEEHVYTITPAEIAERAAPISAAMEALLSTYDDGRLRHDGVKLAIVGPPNAGKSSLLNHLLAEERAIVTDIAGTTRDYIEEACTIGGVHFRLIDTAGIRQTADRVEAIGVEHARRLAQSADVVLVVGDASKPDELEPLFEELQGRAYGVLWNKTDLATPPVAAQAVAQGGVSLRTGEGVDALEPLLLALASDAGYQSAGGSVLIARARHRDTLTEARDALQTAVNAAMMGLDHTFIALDLRASLDAIASMTGAITSDDILNRIFSGFCVGK